jgi:hypothetical protein
MPKERGAKKIKLKKTRVKKIKNKKLPIFRFFKRKSKEMEKMIIENKRAKK